MSETESKTPAQLTKELLQARKRAQDEGMALAVILVGICLVVGVTLWRT